MPHTRYTFEVPSEPTGRGGRPVRPIFSLTPSSWKILISCVDDQICTGSTLKEMVDL